MEESYHFEDAEDLDESEEISRDEMQIVLDRLEFNERMNRINNVSIVCSSISIIIAIIAIVTRLLK